MPSLPQQFQSFLQGSKKLSSSTIANYVSDAQSFINYLSQTLQQSQITSKHITPASIKAFQTHLTQTCSPATANRRLSSLRKFCFFLQKTNQLNRSPIKNLPIKRPLSPSFNRLLNQYHHHLKNQNLALSSIQNYLSDAKQYLLWVKQQGKITEGENNTTTVD